MRKQQPTVVFEVIQSLLPEASEWGDAGSRSHQDARCLVVFGQVERLCTTAWKYTKMY